MPVRLLVSLGNINSDITLNHYINIVSWPTSPYKLPSFVLVRLPVRLGVINNNINKIQYKPKVLNARRKGTKALKKLVELSNRFQVKCGLNGGQKKPAKKNPCGKKYVQEIWVVTKAQAPNDEKPILRRLYKKEIRTADPTRLNAMVPRKERTKQKN